MSSQIAPLDLLIHELTRLPGIGEKTAQRLAYFILKSGDTYSQNLQHALKEVAEKVHHCAVCFAYTDQVEVCKICSHTGRSDEIICVVEQPSDILKIETSGVFRGKYHVLQGAIAPLEGVLPEHLKIPELMARVKTALSHQPVVLKEIVLAFDANLEGDTTALYIAKLLTGLPVRLTRIAHGVPFGTDIDYIDRRTLGRALENRVEL